METENLTELIDTKSTIYRDGIYVDKKIAEKTVWDKLAVENPTHAVISARDEKEALEKSADQMADIRRHLSSDDILLDCGTGYGRVAKYLLPEMQLKGYVGLDSAYQMLSLFRDRYEDNPVEKQTPLLLVNGDIDGMPLVDNSVDKAIISAVYLHNHKSIVEKAVKDLFRVMKPEGKALVYSSFPRAVSLMGIQGLAYQALLNLLGKPYKNGPVRYYRKKEIDRLFADFSEIEIIPIGYELLPKRIIILPKFIDKWWRILIAKPINSLLEKVTPNILKPYFAAYFDVVAIK